jgi:CHAT domain-containing protein
MSYALFVAGCRATVVSQWQVKSGSTALLMAHFYPQLERGAATSQALRQAALALLKDPRYRHPFYWAGLILMGRDT